MIKYIYFTATNTTKTVMEALGADINNSVNITKHTPAENMLAYDEGDLIFIGFPVFGGRVPEIVIERLRALRGNGCKAVVVAVYGNRHYDDAIKEMQAFAEKHGCKVVAAIAAVAQHSIVPTIATGRPDATDIEQLKAIRKEIEKKLHEGELMPMAQRQENEVYKEYRQLPITPITAEGCSLCGVCANECPVNVISMEGNSADTLSGCILCMRCVAVCPSGVRQLPERALQAVKERIESRCKDRRENEIFWEID